MARELAGAPPPSRRGEPRPHKPQRDHLPTGSQRPPDSTPLCRHSQQPPQPRQPLRPRQTHLTPHPQHRLTVPIVANPTTATAQRLRSNGYAPVGLASSRHGTSAPERCSSHCVNSDLGNQNSPRPGHFPMLGTRRSTTGGKAPGQGTQGKPGRRARPCLMDTGVTVTGPVKVPGEPGPRTGLNAMPPPVAMQATAPVRFPARWACGA